MELVKGDLHYTEIGGVYIKEQYGWELLIDDKNVCKYIEKVASGATLDFYVDNIIDKDIKPLNQMQLHVVVWPIPTVLKDKVVTQKTFVTIQGYQKQQNTKKRGHHLLVGNYVNKSSARRKLSLDNNVTRDVNNGKKIEKSKKKVQLEENHVNSALPRLTEYEHMKNKNVAENKAIMESMGLTRFKEELKVSGSKSKSNVCAARDQQDEGTDEYNPNVSEEESVQHVTKKKKTKKVIGAGPTTRLRVNASVTSGKEKEVTESVTLPPPPLIEPMSDMLPLPPPLTEAMSDILPPPPPLTENPLQRPQVLCNGSMAAFLQMRSHKMRNEPKKVLEKEVPKKDLDLAENSNQEIEKEVPKSRYIGVTRMDKVWKETLR